MTDNLRDRIGEAIAEALLTMFRDKEYEQQPFRQGAVLDCVPLADAVIAELGLRKEDSTYDGFFGRKERHRYVTNWEAE